jgi:hypothetical protein
MIPVAQAPSPEGASRADNRRALSILARSLFRQMREQGYSPEQIVALSSELLELVSHDLRQVREATDARWAAE